MMTLQPTNDPATIAARFMEKLTAEETSYAVSPERGDYRGFAALHDLFDANEVLWESSGLENYSGDEHTELMNSAMEHINARLLARN